MATGDTVAVKIIDIDESDTINPRQANSYSEFLKEVNALKLLSESRARNINHVIEALPVGQAMWMITEYCGGGSIATLVNHCPSRGPLMTSSWLTIA
jgi:serine/threonine protein kinase